MERGLYNPASHFQQPVFGSAAYSRWIFSTSSSSYTDSSNSSSISSPSVACPLLLPAPDQSLTQEKQRQMFQEHTTALGPTPQHLPFVLDQQLTPGKNWPYRHAHTHTKNTAAQICTGSTVVQLNEQHTHTYTHTHTPSAVQIPSVSLIVATLGSGLVSAS